MRNNLLDRLRIAAGQLDGIKWNPAKGHEGDLYAEAVNEIERLRQLNDQFMAGVSRWKHVARCSHHCCACSECKTMFSIALWEDVQAMHYD